MRSGTPQSSLDSRQFLLAVNRLADSLGPGSDLSRFVGSGVDYAKSRLYQPGDPVKNIDWPLTARMGKTYIKEFDAVRRMNLYFLVDNSESMVVSSTGRSKFDWAVLIAGALAVSAISRMNPVAFFSCASADDSPIASTDPSARFHPSLSRQQVHTRLVQLRQPPALTARTTKVSNALRDMILSTREKSVVVVLSDLHELAVAPALSRTAQQHDVLVLRLMDPAENVRVGGGIFRGQEAETGRRFTASGRRPLTDPSVVNRELRKAGVDLMTLPTDKDFIPALRMFLKQRGHRKGSN